MRRERKRISCFLVTATRAVCGDLSCELPESGLKECESDGKRKERWCRTVVEIYYCRQLEKV